VSGAESEVIVLDRRMNALEPISCRKYGRNGMGRRGGDPEGVQSVRHALWYGDIAFYQDLFILGIDLELGAEPFVPVHPMSCELFLVVYCFRFLASAIIKSAIKGCRAPVHSQKNNTPTSVFPLWAQPRSRWPARRQSTAGALDL
jgi:hypothetical protein